MMYETHLEMAEMGEQFALDQKECNVLDYLMYVFKGDIQQMIAALEDTDTDADNAYNAIPSDMLVCDQCAAEIWHIDKSCKPPPIKYNTGGYPSRIQIDDKIGGMFVKIRVE